MKVLILTENLTNEELALAKQAMAKVKLLLPYMEFFYQTTNAKFTSIPVSNNVATGYILDASQILPLVSGDFDIACLLYSWKGMIPQPTNPATSLIKKGNCIPMAIPKEWYNNYENILIQYFLHECVHAESFRNGQKDLADLMNNMDLDINLYNYWSSKQPIDFYVYLLKGLLKPPTTPNSAPTVVLTRNWDNGTQTLGELKVGTFSCKTLERPWKLNQKNISAIPTGIYICKYTFSPRFLKFTYELQNVPNRSGIRIHSLNTFFQTDGCIGLGDKYGDVNKDKFADILNSRITINAFEKYMGKKTFLLVIKNL